MKVMVEVVAHLVLFSFFLHDHSLSFFLPSLLCLPSSASPSASSLPPSPPPQVRMIVLTVCLPFAGTDSHRKSDPSRITRYEGEERKQRGKRVSEEKATEMEPGRKSQ